MMRYLFLRPVIVKLRLKVLVVLQKSVRVQDTMGWRAYGEEAQVNAGNT